MKSSSDYIPSRAVAILNVGEPKSGKTRIMMSFPVPGILDIDMNLNSAVRVAGGKKFFYSQPIFDDKGAELPVEKRWENAVKETKALIANPETKSICIDGLSLLSDWCLAYCEATLKMKGVDVEKQYMAKYQSFITIMNSYVSMLRIGGKYVFVTCHQIMDKEEGTGKVRYSLAIPGQLKDRLQGLFTDVWAATSTPNGAKTKYEIRTKPTGFHVNLGTSFDLDPAIDITDKTPDQVWSILEPKLSYHVALPKA